MIFVSGLHQESELDTIRDACSDYGKVSNVHLNLDRRTGFVKGYALVEFCEMSEAEKAIESLNGSMLLGKQIRVDWAFAGPGGVDVCVAQSARKKAKIEVS